MTPQHYWEDFAVGQAFRAGDITLTAEQITAFATDFDPQPAHTDPAAAADTFFGELVASGWHTAALTMRLLVQCGLNVPGGLVGVGLDEVKWPRPVRPGESLRIIAEVLEVRALKSRPQQGIVRVHVKTLNQDDEPVQTLV